MCLCGSSTSNRVAFRHPELRRKTQGGIRAKAFSDWRNFCILRTARIPSSHHIRGCLESLRPHCTATSISPYLNNRLFVGSPGEYEKHVLSPHRTAVEDTPRPVNRFFCSSAACGLVGCLIVFTEYSRDKDLELSSHREKRKLTKSQATAMEGGSFMYVFSLCDLFNPMCVTSKRQESSHYAVEVGEQCRNVALRVMRISRARRCRLSAPGLCMIE